MTCLHVELPNTKVDCQEKEIFISTCWLILDKNSIQVIYEIFINKTLFWRNMNFAKISAQSDLRYMYSHINSEIENGLKYSQII